MENNGLMVVPEIGKAIAKTARMNYDVQIGEETVKLIRNEDFQKLPKTKRPSLLKSGAEKLQMAYKLRSQYRLLNDHGTVIFDSKGVPLFNYEIMCDLYAGDVLICSGVGCANTREPSSGLAGDYQMANKTFKVAKKRALVDAILTVSGLSGMFKRDIEDDENEEETKAMIPADPNAKITSKQMQRLFAIAGQHGKTRQEAKDIIVAAGYESSKAILQKDYEKICEMMAKEKDE